MNLVGFLPMLDVLFLRKDVVIGVSLLQMLGESLGLFFGALLILLLCVY
jgi:hypothetical protein